jgi:hypothetical protein
MKNFPTTIMARIILFAWVVICALIIFSCGGPAGKQHRQEQRIARMLKKNPQLVDTDTVVADIFVNVEPVMDTVQFQLTPDLWPVENMLNDLDGKIDSTFLDSLEQQIKRTVEHASDFDKTIKTKKSTVHVTKKGNNVTVDVVVDPPDEKVSVPVAVTKINPPAIEPRWYETTLLKIQNTVGWLGFSLLFLLIIYIVYKIVRAVNS